METTLSLSDFPYLHPLPAEIGKRLTEEADKSCPDCGQRLVAILLSGGMDLYEDDERLQFKCDDCNVSAVVSEIPDWVPVTDLVSSDDGKTTTFADFQEAEASRP